MSETLRDEIESRLKSARAGKKANARRDSEYYYWEGMEEAYADVLDLLGGALPAFAAEIREADARLVESMTGRPDQWFDATPLEIAAAIRAKREMAR